MNSNITKNFKKIITAISELHTNTKKALKIGFWIFFVIFSSGILSLIFNYFSASFNYSLYFTSTSIIKASFTILAEITIGSLLIDYFFKRQDED